MTDLSKIAAVMGGEVNGNVASFPTPGHSKADRGSWASIKPGAPDGILVHSSNGGDPLAIKDQLRASGVLPEREQRVRDHAVRLDDGQRIVATYEYRKDGVLLYRKHRVEPGRNGRRKDFAFDHPEGAGWAPRIGDTERVPYLADGLAAGGWIYMAEGERCADKLASWGLTATSSKDWRREFGGYVEGRHVVILPDNDEEGERLAEDVAGKVQSAGGTVQIVRLPGLPAKGDIIDWSKAHGAFTNGVHELESLVGTGGEAEPDWPALDLAACAIVKAPKREWIVKDWVPAGKATLVSGDGGVGKSLLEQQKATCVAMGLHFMGLETRRATAAYLSWEDDADELWRRQEAICAMLGVPMASLAGRLHLVSYTEEESPFVAVTSENRGITVTPLGRRIEKMVDRHGIGLLILDNASQIAGIDHNAVEQVAPFAHWLGTLAKRCDGAVLLLHHTNKAGQDYLGSVSYNNQFRSRLLLARPEESADRDARVLSNPKANYAQSGNSIPFRWLDGAFVRDEDLPANGRAEIAANAAANADNDIFLICLAERTRQSRAVSEKTGRNLAPVVFANMPESKRIGKARLEAAMDRLFRISRIERAELWKGPDRKPVFGLREVRGTPAGNGAETRCGNAGNHTAPTQATHTHILHIPGAAVVGPAPSREEEGGRRETRVIFAAEDEADDGTGGLEGWGK